MAVAVVEHSVQIGNGVRAIGKREGVEIRTTLNSYTEEVICTATWQQLDTLRALALDAR